MRGGGSWRAAMALQCLCSSTFFSCYPTTIPPSFPCLSRSILRVPQHQKILFLPSSSALTFFHPSSCPLLYVMPHSLRPPVCPIMDDCVSSPDLMAQCIASVHYRFASPLYIFFSDGLLRWAMGIIKALI
eukprot:GHVS01074524.1.p1 GENE.GHVS01074524.1~~GHVS01074524.1.p1  ORF type:complete len:130 (-),score=21.51 GHVS01074524.1:430-819(-)